MSKITELEGALIADQVYQFEGRIEEGDPLLTRSTSPEVECILQFILLRVLNPSKGGRSIFK